MIRIEFEVKEADAVRFFRSKGIEVREIPLSGLFGSVGMKYRVINPANGVDFPLDKAFEAVVAAKQQQVLMNDIDKLTIYQSLNSLMK